MFLASLLAYIALSYSSPAPLAVQQLEDNYRIDLRSASVYPHYKKSREDLTYLNREMSKIGTRSTPNFRKLADGTGWDNLEDPDLLSSNNVANSAGGWYSL